MPKSKSAKQRLVSVEFPQTPTTDVAFRSSDGIRFYLSKSLLQAHCDGFAPPEAPSEAVVPLEEDSSTLELLFQFVGKRRYPYIGNLDIEAVFRLATAADKYAIESALGCCMIQLEHMMTEAPLKVLVFSSEHGYTHLIDKAMFQLVIQDVHPAEIADQLPRDRVLPFLHYKREWDRLTEDLWSVLYEIAPPLKAVPERGIWYNLTGEFSCSVCPQWVRGLLTNGFKNGMSGKLGWTFCQHFQSRRCEVIDESSGFCCTVGLWGDSIVTQLLDFSRRPFSEAFP